MRAVEAHKLAGVGLLLAAALSPGSGESQATPSSEEPTPIFRDALSGSGIDYVNVSGEPDKRHILSTLGAGVALFDYDEDGDLDVYLVNGARVEGSLVVEEAENKLYRNEGNWTFADVTHQAGVGDRSWGMGAAAGDYDDDGLVDLYVTNVGRNVLYRNRGDGTFQERGEISGVADERWGTSAGWFDAEGDGDLDLYVANYIEIDPRAIPAPGQEARCQWFGLDVMCGPNGLPEASDVFFLNSGDGSFRDATLEAGFAESAAAYALGVVIGDYDDDGDTDLYVANDSMPNYLFRNDGAGHFREGAFLAGAALSNEGQEQAGMGVDMGDVNGDGTLDILVTNFSHETNNVYLNHGQGLFTDGVGEVNMQGPSWLALGWGIRIFDFDNDGDQDVYVANGHVYPGVDRSSLKTRYRQRNHLFSNDGAGNFGLVEPRHTGDGLSAEFSSRGAAFGDLDGDGDVDGVIVNIDERPSLLDNVVAASGLLRVRIVGRASNRDGVGARVLLLSEQRSQLREVHASGSFLSSGDPYLHFGVKAGEVLTELRVRWPSGHEQRWPSPTIGGQLILLEPRGGR